MKHAGCKGTSPLIENKIIDQVSYNVILLIEVDTEKTKDWHLDYNFYLYLRSSWPVLELRLGLASHRNVSTLVQTSANPSL